MNLRRPTPIRNIRQGIEDRNTIASRTSHLEDIPQNELLEQYLPQIREESMQAGKPARTVISIFRKKRGGRRCSCFDMETSADANCPICFGSGIVGGWDLHGCKTDIIDTTHPHLKLVNVIADYSSGHRPVMFALEGNSLKGFIETEISLIRNIKKTQSLQIVSGQLGTGNSINVFIKAPNDTVWVALTETSLEQILHHPKIQIRIELNRKSIQVASPKLSHVMLRYQLIPETKIVVNMDLAEESFQYGDLGFTDNFSTGTIYVPAPTDNLSGDDFFVRMNDMKRFKITSVSRNAVSEILLSTSCTCRLLIKGQDPLINFPL